MVNTGAGPNEIIGLEPEDFRLDHEFPHIRLRANGIRQLKTGDRPREIQRSACRSKRSAGLPKRADAPRITTAMGRLVGDGE